MLNSLLTGQFRGQKTRRPRLAWVAAWPILALCGCSYDRVTTNSPTSEILGERNLEDGSTVSYRLQDSGSGSPKLEVRTRRKRELAFLGVSLRELPREQAEAIGQEPWSGLQVERVNSSGAAEAAGLWPGDVLISLAGRPVVSVDQFTERVADELRPGVPVELEVRRGSEAARTISVIPQGRTVEDPSTETSELEGSATVRALTGLSVGRLETDLARDLYQSEVPLLLVARVQPGSPAYLAGLRAGDRIESLDGRSPVTLDELVGAVLARAQERHVEVLASDRPAQLPQREPGPLQLSVNGSLGHHQAKFDLRTDLDRRLHFEIPILYERNRSTESSSWSCLDFVLQFGGNGGVNYDDSEDRRPERSSYLSLLPFGFYEHHLSKDRASYEIFWFIKWESNR